MEDRSKCLESEGVYCYNILLGVYSKMLSLMSFREFVSLSNPTLGNRTSMDLKEDRFRVPFLNIYKPLFIIIVIIAQ